MKLFQTSTLFTSSLFLLLSNALPLLDLPNEPQHARRKVPYSVVPVDGGKDSEPRTQTVTEPPKTAPPVTETILSTTIITESETPTTVVTTFTITSTPSATLEPASPLSPPTTTTVSTVTSDLWTSDTVVVTITPPLTLSPTPYDDGKWHTVYFKPAESSSIEESIKPPEETSHPGAPVEAPTFASTPSNGTYTALMLRGNRKPEQSKTDAPTAQQTKPPMPTLSAISETFDPDEVPSIDVAEHTVPGFDR